MDIGILQNLESVFAKRGIEPRVPKNNNKSEEIRREGNLHFIGRNIDSYMDALLCYNKSICFAENASKQLAIAYANRSAVYFEITMFKECLDNIELARNVQQYPKNLEAKLAAREKKCLERMATGTFDIEAVKPMLSYPPHENIPFVANCVEIRRNVKYGRHLITNRDLKVGDIVAIEKPFCTVVSGNHQYDRCENCTEEHSRSLIPCESCTAVMFCSVECRTEAMQTFHQYECAAIGIVKSMMFLPDIMLPIRLTLCALTAFGGDTKALYDFAEEADLNCDDTTVFEIDHTRRLTPFGMFAPIYCMVNACEEKNGLPLFGTQSDLNMILFHCKFIDQMFKEPTNRHLMKIIEHVSTARSPCTRIHNVRDTMLNGSASANDEQYRHYSLGVYPFRFLFNHSCVPNVITIPYGSQLIMSITRPVKAGEQLFDCYGSCFYKYPRDERRQIHHNFRCACDACKMNYPLMADLHYSPVDIPSSIKRAKLFLLCEPDSRKKALKFFPIVAAHLQKIDKHIPSKDWALMTDVFWRCVLVMHEKEDSLFLHTTNNYNKYLEKRKPMPFKGLLL